MEQLQLFAMYEHFTHLIDDMDLSRLIRGSFGIFMFQYILSLHDDACDRYKRSFFDC